MMELRKKRIFVVGLGRTGIAVARFLAAEGASVVACDDASSPALAKVAASLKELAVEVSLGAAPVDVPKAIDCVVPSPGVHPAHPLLLKAIEKNIPIISELELAAHFTSAPIIAITGTNGKTTTTRLIGSMLQEWGKNVFVGGNIGIPLISCAGKDNNLDFLVVEVSSFQLQWIETFRPRIAVMLNVAPDHLDYHGSMDRYRAAKERIFKNQCGEDLAILNAADAGAAPLAAKMHCRVRLFSSFAPVEKGMFLDGGRLRLRAPGEEDETYPVDHILLSGRHNMENVMAAITAAKECGCPSDVVASVLASFSGLEHRMEYVGQKNGVRFYNDSKGTNVDAVMRALEAAPGPIVLLMGGRNKQGMFAPLVELIKTKVRKVVLFGEARHEIDQSLGRPVDTRIATGLSDAIDMALGDSRKGDTILLSPGCASFDEFLNYEERGKFFKETVGRIIDESSGKGPA